MRLPLKFSIGILYLLLCGVFFGVSLGASGAAAQATTGAVCGGVSQSQNRELYDDCETLLSLADVLGFSRRLAWSRSDPLDEWVGVTIESGKLTALRLPEDEYNLSAISFLPAEIGNLTNLEDLNLANSSIPGPIPPEIGKLTNLKRLDLINSSLYGSIPSEIGNLTNLESLRLTDNDLSGSIPSEIGNLTKLKYLELDENNLSGPIPAVIGIFLTNLRYLHLAENNLSGPIPATLAALTTNLKRLDLADNSLSGPVPSELGALTNLYELFLHDNNLSGCIPQSLRDSVNNNGTEQHDGTELPFCTGGASTFQQPQQQTIPTTLEAPSNPRVADGTPTDRYPIMKLLQWDAVSGAQSYEIDLYFTSTCTGTPDRTYPRATDDRALTLSNYPNGYLVGYTGATNEQRCFKVFAIKDGQRGASSDPVSYTVSATVPQTVEEPQAAGEPQTGTPQQQTTLTAPTNLTSAVAPRPEGGHYVVMGWDGVAGADSYGINIYLGGDCSGGAYFHPKSGRPAIVDTTKEFYYPDSLGFPRVRSFKVQAITAGQRGTLSAECSRYTIPATPGLADQTEVTSVESLFAEYQDILTQARNFFSKQEILFAVGRLMDAPNQEKLRGLFANPNALAPLLSPVVANPDLLATFIPNIDPAVIQFLKDNPTVVSRLETAILDPRVQAVVQDLGQIHALAVVIDRALSTTPDPTTFQQPQQQTTPTTLEAPSNPRVADGTPTDRYPIMKLLQWDAVSGAQSYEIDLYFTSTCTGTPDRTYPRATDDRALTLSNYPNGYLVGYTGATNEQRCFKVFAIKDGQRGASSDPVSYTVSATVPQTVEEPQAAGEPQTAEQPQTDTAPQQAALTTLTAPTNLSHALTEDPTRFFAQLTWDSVTGAQSYTGTLYAGDTCTGRNIPFPPQGKTLTGSTFTIRHTKQSTETIRSFNVRAHANGQAGPLSECATYTVPAVTPKTTEAAAAPTGPQRTKPCTTSFKTWWQDNVKCTSKIRGGTGTQTAEDTTHPTTGSAQYTCTNGSWEIVSASSRCTRVQQTRPCSATTKTWYQDGNRCGAALTAGTHDQTQAVQDTTAPFTGSAQYRCIDGTWQVLLTTRRCGREVDTTPVTPPTDNCSNNYCGTAGANRGHVMKWCQTGSQPRQYTRVETCPGRHCYDGKCITAAQQTQPCPQTTKTWWQNGNRCTGTLSASTGTQTAQDTTQPTTGSAEYTCAAGTWEVVLSSRRCQSTKQTTEPVPVSAPTGTCPATTETWCQGSDCCSGNLRASTGTITARDSSHPLTGSAQYRCVNGTWEVVPSSRRCVHFQEPVQQTTTQEPVPAAPRNPAAQNCSNNYCGTAGVNRGHVMQWCQTGSQPRQYNRVETCPGRRCDKGKCITAAQQTQSCPATTKTWYQNSNRCGAALTVGSHDQIQVAQDTASPFTGSAQYRCINGTWQVLLATRRCGGTVVDTTPVTPPTENCSSNYCGTAGANRGHVMKWCQTGSQPKQYTRVETCQSRSCDKGKCITAAQQAQTCPQTTKSWYQNSNRCTGTLSAGTGTVTAQDTQAPLTGTAQYTCRAGTWQVVLSSRRCSREVDTTSTTPPAERCSSNYCGTTGDYQGHVMKWCQTGNQPRQYTRVEACPGRRCHKGKCITAEQQAQTCPQTTKSWYQNGNRCSAVLQAGTGTVTAQDTRVPRTGSAQYTCTAGTWQVVLSSRRCSR